MSIFADLARPMMLVPMALSGTSLLFEPYNLGQTESVLSLAEESCEASEVIEGLQTGGCSASQGVIYDAMTEDMLAFLRDDSSVDYSDFEKKFLELVRYKEVRQFCSNFLQKKADSDIYLLLNGIIETSVDIYDGDWFERILRTLVSDSSGRTLSLRYAAKVLLDEYF